MIITSICSLYSKFLYGNCKILWLKQENDLNIPNGSGMSWLLFLPGVGGIDGLEMSFQVLGVWGTQTQKDRAADLWGLASPQPFLSTWHYYESEAVQVTLLDSHMSLADHGSFIWEKQSAASYNHNLIAAFEESKNCNCSEIFSLTFLH